MWKNFKSLFSSKEVGGAEEDTAVTELASKYGVTLLTERSPRAEPPAACAVKLWDHQKAMLARCHAIESNPRMASTVVKNADRYRRDASGVREIPQVTSVAVGVLNDLPGSGKTYTILSLLADSKDFNLIVVPQNIFHQWRKAIETMFPAGASAASVAAGAAYPKTKCIDTYGDIAGLYAGFHGRDAPLRENTIVLVNDLFVEPLAQIINDTKIPVRRVVIDEIDSVQQRLHTPIPCKHLWLVSASFAYDNGAAVGPYVIKPADIPLTFCKCDQAFITRSLQLEEPTTEKIVCDDTEVALFKGVVKDATYQALQAGDTRGVFREMEMIYRPGQHTLLELARLWVEKGKGLEGAVKEAEDQYQAYMAEGDSASAAEFNTKLQLAREKLQRRRLLEGRLAASAGKDPVSLDRVATKWAKFESDILARIRQNPGQKWLIFNDNAAALEDAAAKLKTAEVEVALLDGGNALSIQRAIESYKEGSTAVLLLNSKLEAVGMNLENTTHLLFMHATRPQYVEQIVGRAQRYGRKGRLHIVGLFNAGEDPAGAAS